MPASQAAAASERRNDRMTTHEPPKLKTTLKTPPKQATNPLQFVKVGPCSLYRTAQEQLQKVQEVKKIKQEVRDDPEDWQSNLDNWKSSRRKRQEHIIERVVEVKKLELEEHDRQRRRSKTFSEMMEERGNRGRKLSISLAMYQEEDANDLSDLGIGTSSGKSSVSGDTHDDTHSVLSDRDSEIEKNHSDVDSNVVARENGNSSKVATKKSNFGSNGFHCSSNRSHQEYDSATTATASSPEPEEYTYEGAIRGYVSRVAQNIPRRSSSLLVNNLDGCTKSSLNEDSSKSSTTTKSDVLKRREIFEKASQKGGTDTKANRLSGDFANAKTIKERLSNLEKQKQYETTTTLAMSADNSLEKNGGGKALNRLSGDMSSIRERLSLLEKQTSERESKNSARKQQLSTEELETVRPLRERLSTLEKYSSSDESSVLGTNHEQQQQQQQQQQPSRHNGELTAKSIKDRLSALDAAARSKEVEKRCVGAKQHELCCFGRDAETRIDTSTPSERSSSPDSEYRVPRAAFHRSLDSLDADASSGPDTFERVQSLEELDYTRRYQASFSSAELLNDTDREDSGIHTGDVSCSVSQADEPVDEEIVMQSTTIVERQEVMMIDEKPEFTQVSEVVVNVREKIEETKKSNASDTSTALNNGRPAEAVVTKKETAETSSGELSTNKSHPLPSVEVTNTNALRSPTSSSRPVVYQSPKVPPRRSPPELLKPKSVDAPSTTADDPLPVNLTDESEAHITNPEVSASSDQSTLGIVVEPALEESSVRRRDSRTSVVSSLALESIPKNSSPITPPPSPTVAHADSSTAFSSQSAIQESKASGPTQSPRSASKIPTPLPRKIASNKSSPTSSSSIPQSKTSSIKLRTCPPPSKSQTTSSSTFQLPKTAIPSLSEVTSSSSSSSSTSAAAALEVTVVQETRPADRRRTVVEVCEKVVVPQGEAPPMPPVTPFITVARVGDDDSSEEPLVVDKSIIEESIREVTLLEESQIVRGPINMELELTMQNNNNLMKKKKKKDEGSRTMVVEVEDRRDPINTLVDHLSPSTPERPSTLTFEKSTPTFTTMEILSPLSPMSKQILPLNLSSDEEIVTGLAFPLGPPTSAEPPKEKPPPPPVDLSDEENLPTESLKRLNSTRRIKKEIRSRRSDFLGIEGINDDDLEREMTLTKPPDMAAILAEERRIEQLHRRSYDTDSNYEQDSSHERDSGVELGHAEDWTKQAVSPDMSQHSRQSSEPFGASVTSSEEDEITKKEKEIIEVLEKEEQWRYANNRELDSSDIGEKLAHKLRELEEEKMQLERERAQEMELRRQEVDTLRKNEENIRKQEEVLRQQQEEVARQQEVARADAERQAEMRRLEEKKRQEELRIQAEQLRIQSEIEEKEKRAADVRHQEEIRIRTIENQIREQENKAMVGAGLNNCEGEFASGEVLRVERELLQLEQEELKRQRNNLAYREHKQQQLAEQLQEQWKSLQDVAHGSTSNVQQQFKQQPPPMNYRSSMPNLQLQDGQRRRPPPPPIPPAKPLRLVEQRQRDVTIRNSRVPSADSIPQQVDASLRHSTSATALATTHGGQQMTRQTLQALSAAPRPRIVQGDQWVQRRKSDVPRSAQDFNYQHWLIQEAEQRRINEKNQRSPRKVHVTGTSVPYTASPPRSDSKPLPDSIIQTLTQRVQNRTQEKPLPLRRRLEQSTSQEHLPSVQQQQQHIIQQQKVLQSSAANNVDSQEKMLSVSGKNKCSHCGDELGRGAAMIIECLRLFYHMECFKCCVCHVRLGDGLMGTDVRVRNHKLHCHNCYSSDDGVKFSCV